MTVRHLMIHLNTVICQDNHERSCEEKWKIEYGREAKRGIKERED